MREGGKEEETTKRHVKLANPINAPIDFSLQEGYGNSAMKHQLGKWTQLGHLPADNFEKTLRRITEENLFLQKILLLYRSWGSVGNSPSAIFGFD